MQRIVVQRESTYDRLIDRPLVLLSMLSRIDVLVLQLFYNSRLSFITVKGNRNTNEFLYIFSSCLTTRKGKCITEWNILQIGITWLLCQTSNKIVRVWRIIGLCCRIPSTSHLIACALKITKWTLIYQVTGNVSTRVLLLLWTVKRRTLRRAALCLVLFQSAGKYRRPAAAPLGDDFLTV